MSHYPGGGRLQSPAQLGIRRQLRGLGAMAPSAAAAQVIGSDKQVNASSKSAIASAAGALQLVDASGQPAYIPGTAECAAAQGIATGAQNNLKLAQTASGLALTGMNVGLMAAGQALGPITAGISIAVSAIVGLFSTLVQHHAAAVKAEQSTLCSAVPAANNYLSIIAQAVSSGLATPQDGISALESLKGDFRSAVGSIYKDCNAACVMNMELDAICLVMESQFQGMIDAANAAPPPATPAGSVVPASNYSSFYTPSPAVPSTPNTVAAPTSSVPSFTTAPTAAAPASSGTDWLPIAAVVIGGFFLLRSL